MRIAAVALLVLSAFSSPASAIRNGTPELGVEYNAVGMFLPSPQSPLATGILVSQHVVLTAAQNVRHISDDDVYEFTLAPGMTARATEVRPHPEFETIDGFNLAYDLALVALDQDEVRNWPGITRPAILDRQAPVANPVIAVGFGQTKTGGMSGVRHSGSFSINSYLEGADPFGNPISNAFIEVVPRDALNQCMCSGDQGGPLFYKGKIAGVASFRFVATCDEEGPDYYVSLHRFTDWIRDNLNQMDPSSFGDYNGDGTADAADYVVWRKNGATPDDYNTWRANFARTAALGATAGLASSAGVPEPCALILIYSALTIGSPPRRRHRDRCN